MAGSNNGGIAEQIVDGESGLLFSPGNAEDLAEVLHRFLSDPDLRRNISQAGLYRVQKHFSLEDTYRMMATIFNGLAGSGPAVGVALQESMSQEAFRNL